MELEFMPCPTCREVTLVEIPPCTDEPCADEHGDGCPDRACTVCGAALTFVDLVMMDVSIARSVSSAPGRSRAVA